MKIREQEWKSTVAENMGFNPKWENQFMEFDVINIEDDLRIEARDDDLVGSKLIASEIIKISFLLTFNFGSDSEWYTLVDKNGKESGKVNLKTVWHAIL